MRTRILAAISVLLTFCGSLAAQPAASAAQHGIAADHIERSVRPGLGEPKLDGKQREAVAGGG